MRVFVGCETRLWHVLWTGLELEVTVGRTFPSGDATFMRGSDGEELSPAQIAKVWSKLDAGRRAGEASRVLKSNITHNPKGLAWRLGAFMALFDILAIIAAFGAAVLLADLARYAFGIDSQNGMKFIIDRGRELILLIGLTVGVLAFGGLYRRSGWELGEVRKVFGAVALIALFDAALQFVFREHDSRLWFAFAYPLAALAILSARMMVRSLPRVQRAMTSHVVLIGAGVTPDGFINELRESRSGQVKLLSAAPLSRYHGVDAAGMQAHLADLADQARVPGSKLLTVLAPTPWELDEAQQILACLNRARLPYSVVLPFGGLARGGLHLQEVVGADLVLAEMSPERGAFGALALKRIIDVVASLALLIALSPVLVTISALQLLQGGPVFFRQRRVGRNDARFNCLKFRSMRPDAEKRLQALLASDPAARSEWAEFQKLSNDPRITPLGRILRNTSLDELPQLWNVLVGDMSLVGPRPIVCPDIAGYDGDRAYYNHPDFIFYSRCTPGITGLWQVSGRASTSHDERVRLDRWYARNWSLWLDIYVLFKTVGAVLGRTGSR